MSPTIISTMSSIETRPSVPPYSSMTSAICVRVACIRTRRSSAGIERGTNSTGRKTSAVSSSAPKSIEAIGGLVAARRLRGIFPRIARDSRRNRGCAPCRADRRASRHRPAGANGRRCETPRAPRAASRSRRTAMMSARGIIASATRNSCRPNTFLSSARSCGVTSPAVSSSATSMSSRTEAGARPSITRSRSNKTWSLAYRQRDLAPEVASRRFQFSPTCALRRSYALGAVNRPRPVVRVCLSQAFPPRAAPAPPCASASAGVS